MLEKLISMILLSGTLFTDVLYTTVPQKDVNGEIFLVNRDYPICENYIPILVDANVQGNLRLQRVDAATALEEMFQAAKEEKINLIAVSGYRSFSKQDRIYEKKAKKVGEAKADDYVALPGTSEHQLGLAMDLGEKNVHTSLTESFANTKAGIWLVDNAHRFGFVVRYQKNWEEVTGYLYEPWHVRYVGIEHATRMYKENIPMEEYVENIQLNRLEQLLAFGENEIPLLVDAVYQNKSISEYETEEEIEEKKDNTEEQEPQEIIFDNENS